MFKSELSIEEASEMSARELSRVYGIPRTIAYYLKIALRPDRYSIITNHELSLEEMGKKIGVSWTTIDNYRGALRKAGLETKKKPVFTKKRKVKTSCQVS
jgi:hypothetical protein